MAAGQIDIFGKLHAATSEGILVVTDEIKDAHYNKTQAEINSEFGTLSVRVDNLEDEFDDGGRISAIETEITAQAGLIETKVSQTDFDENNNIISEQFSDIRQTADQIQLTVEHNKQEADGSFQSVQSLITQQAEMIATKVSQTEYDANNLFFSERFSSIEQTADHILSTVEEYRLESNESVAALQTQILQQSDAILLKAEKTELDSVQAALSYSIGELSVRSDSISATVTGIQQEIDSHDETLGAYYEWLTSLQTQVDGEIDTWFKDYSPLRNVAPQGEPPVWELDPTVSPYSDWLIEEQERGFEVVRDAHVRDVFYNTATGYGYIFTGTGERGSRVYSWSLITNSAVVEALAAAARAQTTADGKMRTFLIQPTPPYQPGDMWIKPHTVTIDGSDVTYKEVWNCITEKTEGQAFSISDWAKSDSYDAEITKANLKILSDAIVGQVATYDADGLITNKSTIEQKADQIRLTVANTAIGTGLAAGGSINTALLDTGIDITHGDITLVANHISLKNQNDVTGLQLITLSSGDVVIDIDSLNVSGIFSTSPAWIGTGGVGGERNSVLSDASTAATNMLNTALYGNGGTAQNPTGGIYGSAIFEALEGTSTVIAGGLILSTALILGGNTGTGGDWQEWAGMYGNYDSTAGRGGGPAAWYGGTDLDAFTISNWNTMTPAQKEAYWTSHRYARTMFRQDGSGYLANGEISWSETGSVVIHGATLYDSSNNDISISDLVELKSWFTKVSYTDGNGNTRYAIKLVTGTTAGSIGGFCTDGFITAGGVGSGGGGGGIDLNRVWQSLTNNTDKPNVKINAAHIPYGSGLVLNSTTGLIDAVGAVQSVAGLTGQITASQLQTALGLGAAAYLGVGSVASGNAGLVTGGAVYSAINLALSSAIKIRGVTTTALTDGATTNPIIIDGASYTAVLGDEVLYGGKEYLWIGNKWQQLGDEESWALKTVSITGTGYLTGGGTLSENRTIDISASVKTKIDHGETAYSWEDELCFVDPESGEEVIIDDPGTTGTVMWGAESGYRVALDVNGVSKMLLKAGALDNVYTRLSDLQAAVGSLVMVNTIAGVSGAITLGTGLTMVGNELSVTGPTIGTVTRVDLGNTQYNPSSAGVVSLPAYPTTLPASDVYAWAKAANKPTYAFSEITGTASTSQIPDLSYTKIIGLGDAATRGVASTIGSSVTALVPGSLLYSVLGDAFDSSNTVKAFVNSSIATATATFRGTNTTATTESAFLTWANGLTHDLNDYVFWGTIDGDGNTVYKRYKYNGTSWAFEYDLNNSSFTSAQWAAISSGITSVLVAAFNAKYDKPSGGIPKSDLASAVQASLVLADGSLQGGWVFERNSAIYDSEDYVHVN